MGNTITNELEYIHSPKLHHCPIKSFPIPIPTPTPSKVSSKQNHDEIKSHSLPGSFKQKTLNNKQDSDNESSTTMGRHISSNQNNRYNLTPT